MLHSITETDICNVPISKIYSNNCLNKYVQLGCQYVLRSASSRVDGFKDDEVFILMDTNGAILFEKFGYRGSIEIINDEKYYDIVYDHKVNSLIAIHNHPNNSGLSYNDIVTFMTAPSIVTIIAVGNDGRVNSCSKLDNTPSEYFKLAKVMAITLEKYRGKVKNPLDYCIIKLKKNSEKLKLKFKYSPARR